MSYKGRVAIITGAGSGIGRASAIELATRGFSVVVTDVNDEGGLKTVELIGSDKSIFVHHDVSNYNDWENVVATTVEKFGAIHVLFNNAGMNSTNTDTATTDIDLFDKVMQVTGSSAFYGCKACSKYLIEAGPKGSVINSSSVFGISGGFGNMPAYSAAKSAVRGLSKNIALNWAKYGVRVNSIHPGYIETQMLRGGAQLDTSEEGKKRREALISDVPLQRIGTPEDIAKVVAFLASDDSSYVTGTEMIVDGGFLAK